MNAASQPASRSTFRADGRRTDWYSMSDEGLLDENTVGPYAISRGLLPDGPTQSKALSGGISNIVLMVASGERRVVVKQALGKLRVSDDWRADPARSQAEAAALQVLGALTPHAVPVVLDADPARDALVISPSPASWQMWKTELLGGVVRPDVAATLGALLSLWHRATDHEALPAILERTDLFDQLRLDPYFGTSARRRQVLADDFDRVTTRIRQRRRCLVLGDFSPKNVLVGADGLWVIDLEVAHRGDPSFDVAFLLTHLVAKAVHMPDRQAELLAAARAFLHDYGDGPGVDDGVHVAQVLGALLVARVAGSSPLEYLTPEERIAVERIGTALLTDVAASLEQVIVQVSKR